ncbi:protein mab-21-like 3 [Hydractinia symbiolongicarpus]|uniref:protein mab-21-like 3 n=1 Tax=Hydractinia symbiolongicarpus TaxID=13093 RepID=UPI00254C7B60|nr:protein mab-21-like 3 [Hydractinia symbiolongicarpus]
MYYKCLRCKNVYSTELDLIYHEEDDHDLHESAECDVCLKRFPRRSDCLRHKQTKHQKSILLDFLKNRYAEITVEASDRKVARLEVQKVFEALADCFGNGIFLKQFQKSGSYSTKTKELHANEFDFDVPLKFQLEKLHLNYEKNEVYQHFDQAQKNLKLNVPMKVTRKYYLIPQGYVEIKRKRGEPVVPREIQEELYQDLMCAKGKVEGTLDVFQEAEGPALTVRMKPPGLPNITINLCASIATDKITLRHYRWPRPQTRNCLSPKLIRLILNAGLHLTPKHLKFWYISVSKAGQALMNGIDDADKGCRRQCHKLLKADFQTWLGRSGNNLPGISTMVLKHQLFWMNEKKQLDWSEEKLADRYLDMLEDLSQRLRSGKLYNYFLDYENIFEDKDQQVLNEVANYANARSQGLIAMG